MSRVFFLKDLRCTKGPVWLGHTGRHVTALGMCSAVWEIQAITYHRGVTEDGTGKRHFLNYAKADPSRCLYGRDVQRSKHRRGAVVQACWGGRGVRCMNV